MSSTSLHVRPLEAGDTDTVHHVFAGLSVTSAYHRFGTGLTLLPPRMAAQLAAVEPGRHRVFVAELDGRPVGLARWIRPRGGRTDEVEVALEVGDEWQGRGVGRALLAEVARDARAAGVADADGVRRPGQRPDGRLAAPAGCPATARPRRRAPPGRAAGHRGLRAGCGCMTSCRCASSARSGSGTGSRPPPPRAASGRATCWRSWSPVADGRSRRRSSSTWSGATPRPHSRPPPCTPWSRACAASSATGWCAPPTRGTSCPSTWDSTRSGSPPWRPRVSEEGRRRSGAAGRRSRCGPGGRPTPGCATTW